MGSPEEPAASSKPPNPKPAAVAAPSSTPAAPSPPPAATDPPPAMPYPDWSASMQAYYAAGGAAAAPAAFYPPAAWGGQMMAAYGAPLPYSPMYYAHPSMTMGMPYPTPESDGKEVSANKSKNATPGKSGDGGKATSGSGYDDATQSGDSGSEGSTATNEDSLTPQDSNTSRKRTGHAIEDGVSHGGRIAKLPVSAPGRAALTGPATNLNIGMDVWSAPHPLNAVPVMPGQEAAIPGRQWMQMDERELKRERRKQSNRDSARRSRMRKMQECEEYAKKVSELSGENTALKVELEKLKKDFEELRSENVNLMGRLKSKNPELLTEKERTFI